MADGAMSCLGSDSPQPIRCRFVWEGQNSKPRNPTSFGGQIKAYDLNAEGTNGVASETTVLALQGFTSAFGISVWNVDALAAPSIDAIHRITSGGAVGVYG